ncbi:MAG: PBP1A family penicillin-binding protein [Deltaproteobacteria bacterium]|nr:PBP1A family penicillin-binding protein [Deltaproteobacteria bacterium]
MLRRFARRLPTLTLRRTALLVAALLLLGLVGGGLLFTSVVWSGLPDVGDLDRYRPPLPSVVVDRHGVPIGRFVEQRRQMVALRDIPPHVVDAILAAEDDGFYRHSGIDVFGMLRAAFANLRAGRIEQGASTITQQVAKNIYLNPERTYMRKLRDVALALEIEWTLSKDEILEIYLNQIYFGSGAYGIAEAAMTYFGKPVGSLSVSEAALLAGLPPAPSRRSPHRDPRAAEDNRRAVLLRMRDTGRLARGATSVALGDKPEIVELVDREQFTDAAYFVEEVRQQVFEALGSELVLRGGLRIESTLDARMQREAVAAVRRGLEAMKKDGVRDRQGRPAEGALVALDVKSGDVLAMVGGSDFGRSRFNRAVQAKRQPGSAFKPFAYGAALELGYPPNATLYDYQVEFRDRKTGKWWRPKNYNGEFRGPVSMTEAFARSLNNPTIRLVEEVGVDRVIDYARRAGIRSKLSRDLGLGLGTNEVTLLELTSAYGTFARGGRNRDPRVVRRVVDADGKVLLEDVKAADLPPRQSKKRIGSIDAYLTTYLMKEAVRAWYGTGHGAARLGTGVAGKTGSTNENRDAWFLGYTPEIVTGVWVGHDDRTPMARHRTGAGAALPIWTAFMDQALAGRKPGEFAVPDGLRFAGVSSETGEWVRSTVPYPGWVPVAADRKVRRARFVPSPWPEEEAVAPAIAAGVPGAPAVGGGLPDGVGAAGSGAAIAAAGPSPAPVGAGPPVDPTAVSDSGAAIREAESALPSVRTEPTP